MGPVVLYVLRHGRSLANEASLIVSSEENGVKPEYALAEKGKLQAAEAGRQLAAALAADAAAAANTVAVTFYASPFSRTVETAAIASRAFEEAVAAEQQQQQQQQQQGSAAGTAAAPPPSIRLAAPPDAAAPRVERALRERWFGSALELQNHDGYSPAWASDARDPSSKPPGHGDGESVVEVAARCAELLDRLAEQHCGGRGGKEEEDKDESQAVVVLVSHGDTLSILQAAASGGDVPLGEHRKFGLATAELKRVGLLSDAARQAAEAVEAAAAAAARAR
jgi:broad specificity phosphatase PhoE